MTDDVVRALLGATSGDPARQVRRLQSPWRRGPATGERGLPALVAFRLQTAGLDDVRTYTVDASGGLWPARGAERWLARAWYLSAGRSATPPLVERVLSTVAAGALRWRLAVSAKDKALLFVESEAGSRVVRVPCSDAATQAEARAHETLVALAREGLLSGVAPLPLGGGQVDGQSYFVEQRLPGQPVAATLREADRARLAAQAEVLLAGLSPALEHEPTRTIAGALEDVVRRHVQAVAACLPFGDARDRAAARLLEAILPVRSRLGRVHGDFSAANLFVHHGRLSGLVDWENSQAYAPPVLDVLNHLDSMQRRCRRETLAETVPRLAHGRWPHDAERAWLERAYARCGVAPQDRVAMVLLYWVLHVGPQLAFADAGAAARRHVVPVLERVWPA